MLVIQETFGRLGQIPNLQVSRDAPLARDTRFGIGGPADIYAETASVESFVAALETLRESGLAWVVIGGGTNLVVADAGFRGIVLRFTADTVRAEGNSVVADAGAELQSVVDCSIAAGLGGLETLAGIPGSLGAAVYGNAGAYGHSLAEVVSTVRYFDGASVRIASNAACEFHYRESIFKRNKEWVIFSAALALTPGDRAPLQKVASDIVDTRNRKFPPTMKCAGSVFKNLILAELPAGAAAGVPPAIVREGKVPAAYFLEQAGAKGQVCGDIHVADYHANLIYNAGAGTARDLREMIARLKQSVYARFGFELEEEVQYVGFPSR